MVIQIADFIRFYGHAMYKNPDYATDDNVIPWKLFFLYSRATNAVRAVERWSNTRSAIHARLMTESTDKAMIKRWGDDELKTMYGED